MKTKGFTPKGGIARKYKILLLDKIDDIISGKSRKENKRNKDFSKRKLKK